MTLPAVNSLPSLETINTTLRRGGVVITATQRLARDLIQQVSLQNAVVIEKPALTAAANYERFLFSIDICA